MLENVDRKPHKLILLGRAVTATLIGFVSMFVLYQTIRRDYYDYFLYPRLKAAEGYLYPQWRYVIADCAVIAWGTVGVLASTLLYRSILNRLPLDKWARKSVLAFGLMFCLLVVAVIIGTLMRRVGI